MLSNSLKIESGAFTCITFLLDSHFDACQLSFVGNKFDETQKRNLDEVLIIAFAEIYRLFPFRVVAYDDMANEILQTILNDEPTGFVEIIFYFLVSYVTNLDNRTKFFLFCDSVVLFPREPDCTGLLLFATTL